uniref:Uncharacterized protein LOC111114036 n=1 Tax=Crassostrea virginica TaxID=6565 RepID=A0A8B8BXC6_CRAVI|nr:uncharacterized protein LOC111114036 [Crassostrea virginica]
MAGRTYFKVKSCCESNPSLSKNFFLSGKADQSIGDVLYPHLSQYNVAVSEIRTSNSEAGKPSTITQPDTPISGLESFGVRFIFVDIKQNDSDKRGVAEDKGKGSAKPNVFDVLMNVQKSYDKLPPSRKENNAKDKMYNAVLNLLKKKGVGFTSMQVESSGVYITKTLTDVLWYLDPHIDKFNARCIYLGDDFIEFRGYNDWRHQKRKEPTVASSDLHDKVSELLTMIGHPFFLSKESKKLLDMCNTLVCGMKKYLDFLSEQKERTAFNHQKPETVRGLNDKWSLRKLDISHGVNKNCLKLHESLAQLEPFDPLFLYYIQPEDKFEKRKWMDNLTLPYPVKLYTHKFGNYLGNFHFVWKVEDDDATGDLEAISSIKEHLPIYATRAMSNEFINRYSKTGTKPAILRDMYRFLTRDASAAVSSDERAVDDRVLEFLLQSDAPEMFYDLRKNNGRPKDTKLDPFWNALDSYLEELLFDQQYATQGDLKSSMQSNKDLPEPNILIHLFSMMKELAVKLGKDCALICLDDKSIVPIGEPGSPTSTGVRAHNKSLIPEGAKLSALDHDFHIHGAVPSVLLDVELPECKDDSFYNGVLHVTVKDKVLPHPVQYAMHLKVYSNPAERCMSLLNLGLQNISLQRNAMDGSMEYMVKSASTLKKLRDLSERQPNVKTALGESLEPTLSLLKHRFSKLKLHDRRVVVHDAATLEEIQNISDLLDLFKDTEDSSSVIETKEKNAPEKLKAFIDTHCRASQYSFQRLPENLPLHWLPDTTKGPDDTFHSLEALLGTETTDRDCPGLNAKGTATENDKKHKGVLVAGKVRSFVMCCLCGKRRVVYCKERLSRQQITDIEEVQDSLFYTCGSTLFPTGHRYHETIVVKEELECTAEMETTYYAGITTKFQPVCFFCGDTEVDSTSQTVQDLRKNYSIVRPICRQCMSKGIQPKVRNALKLNKK